MNEQLRERVCGIIANTFAVDPASVDETTSAQTLSAWTSLAHLRLLTNVQEAFGVRFTMSEMGELDSVGYRACPQREGRNGQIAARRELVVRPRKLLHSLSRIPHHQHVWRHAVRYHCPRTDDTAAADNNTR
jgi:acyl carrier protein